MEKDVVVVAGVAATKVLTADVKVVLDLVQAQTDLLANLPPRLRRLHHLKNE